MPGLGLALGPGLVPRFQPLCVGADSSVVILLVTEPQAETCINTPPPPQAERGPGPPGPH